LTHSVLVLSHVTAPTDIYTLSLHDALPISTLSIDIPDTDEMTDGMKSLSDAVQGIDAGMGELNKGMAQLQQGIEGLHGGSKKYRDRKSTRLNSSHVKISYAVFCLKKKKKRE